MSRHFTTFPRQLLTTPLALLAALLCLGTLGAPQARAGITIDSISGVPNPVPAAGGTKAILIDCGNAVGVPTGGATLINSNGTTVSYNPVYFYQADADGNPIVYTFAVFPASNSGNGTPTYTLNITVNSGDGSTASRSLSLTQGGNAAITIDSVTLAPAVLAASATSVSATIHITANGPNQAGFLNGLAYLYDSAGNALSVAALQPGATDSTGNPVLTTTLGAIPVNTSPSARVYTLNIQARDKSGVWGYGTASVTQSAGSVTITPVTTSLSAAAVSGTIGQPVALSATLTASGAAVTGRSVSFTIDGAAVGSSATNSAGVALLPYTLPSGTTVGAHTITASFAGDSSDTASSGTATLTASNPVIIVGNVDTLLTVNSRTVTAGQTFHLVARLRQSSDRAYMAGETLTISVDGTAVGTGVTNAYGLVSLPYKALTQGYHNITASFAGDSTYAASSGGGTLTVPN